MFKVFLAFHDPHLNYMTLENDIVKFHDFPGLNPALIAYLDWWKITEENHLTEHQISILTRLFTHRTGLGFEIKAWYAKSLCRNSKWCLKMFDHRSGWNKSKITMPLTYWNHLSFHTQMYPTFYAPLGHTLLGCIPIQTTPFLVVPLQGKTTPVLTVLLGAPIPNITISRYILTNLHPFLCNPDHTLSNLTWPTTPS